MCFEVSSNDVAKVLTNRDDVCRIPIARPELEVSLVGHLEIGPDLRGTFLQPLQARAISDYIRQNLPHRLAWAFLVNRTFLPISEADLIVR